MSFNINKLIGERIKIIRKSKKFTREKLSELTGLSVDFLGRVERGERSLSIPSLLNISESLSIRVSEIIEINLKESNKDSIIFNIDNYLKKAQPQDLEKLLVICKELYK